MGGNVLFIFLKMAWDAELSVVLKNNFLHPLFLNEPYTFQILLLQI